MRFCHSFRSGIPLFRAGHLRVTHPFATNVLLHPSDLHVLGTPPAFILSQDQTLRYFSFIPSFKDMFSFCSPESIWFVSSFLLLLNCQGSSRPPVSQAQRLIICVFPFMSRTFFNSQKTHYAGFFCLFPEIFRPNPLLSQAILD